MGQLRDEHTQWAHSMHGIFRLASTRRVISICEHHQHPCEGSIFITLHQFSAGSLDGIKQRCVSSRP